MTATRATTARVVAVATATAAGAISRSTSTWTDPSSDNNTHPYEGGGQQDAPLGARALLAGQELADPLLGVGRHQRDDLVAHLEGAVAPGDDHMLVPQDGGEDRVPGDRDVPDLLADDGRV